MDNNKATAHPDSAALLPDFCTNQTVLTAMLIGELLAFILTVSTGRWNLDTLTYLAYASFFIQWITLSDIALLCWGKPWFARLDPIKMMIAIYASMQVITIVISEMGYQIVKHVDVGISWNAELHMRLIGSNLITSMIITAVAMRYFYLQHQNVQRLKAETQAKIEALQARIRPHFLFNSMNTIANLIHEDPYKAEDAVLDLSELFRSSLGKHDFVSLQEEIRITQRYTNIESLRLNDRLNMQWTVPNILPNLQLPALTLQPLVENAIYHGIEPMPEGGDISVSVEVNDDYVTIIIINPIPSNVPESRSKGNNIALNNTRQRLALAYGGKGQMHIENNGKTHTVTLTIPLERGEYESSDR